MKRVIINDENTNYFVSEFGEVFRVNKWDGRVKKLKNYIDKDGYEIIILHHKGKPYMKRIARLVAQAYIPNPDNLPEVNHKDGIKINDYYKNLEWCTTKYNIHHAWANNLATAKKLEDHPNSKYTNEQITLVCKLLEKGDLSYKEISKMTGVSYTVVKQVKNKVIWVGISKNFNIDNYKWSKKRNKDMGSSTIESIV